MTQTDPPSLDAQVKLTPMMEQYRSIKKTLPSDTILFFRLGDFYEMFFEDAVCASDILNITLTGREGGEAGRDVLALDLAGCRPVPAEEPRVLEHLLVDGGVADIPLNRPGIIGELDLHI